MQLKLQRRSLFLIAITILLLSATVSWSQEDTTPKKRLRSPATVRGFVGGESQDRYVIRARKGQIMTVRISWRPEGDNSAGFSVSSASESDDGEQVVAGRESDNGKRWRGRISKSGDYIISVTAHPSAHYTLRVAVK